MNKDDEIVKGFRVPSSGEVPFVDVLGPEGKEEFDGKVQKVQESTRKRHRQA